MEASPPESPRLELPGPARSISPPVLRRILPLRVVKRSDSSCGGSDVHLDDASRKCSQETDESRGSAPEPPGGHVPLTIPKIRGNRTSQIFSSFDDVDECPGPLGRQPYAPKATAPFVLYNDADQVPAASMLPLNLRYSPVNRDAHAIDSFRSRDSLKIRDKVYTRSEAGFKDHFAFMNSNQAIPSTYRPFPGFQNILQKSMTGWNSIPGQPSPLTPCAEDDASNDPFTSQPRHDGHHVGSSGILVPTICVTPHTRIIDSSHHNFWVAVEVTADLRQCGDEHKTAFGDNRSQSHGSIHSTDPADGFLYDLQIEVEPTLNSTVLEVIEHEAATRTFIAGSKSLVLVNVLLDLAYFSRLRGHIRSKSDELMEDLEHQLGSAQCEYMKVNLLYRHSAFSPSTSPAGGTGLHSGVTKSDTKIRTGFTAAINRYNAASLWSPPPAPTPNRLVGIIAAH